MYYHRMFITGAWSTVGPGKLEKPEMCAGGPMCVSCVYFEGTGVQPLTGLTSVRHNAAYPDPFAPLSRLSCTCLPPTAAQGFWGGARGGGGGGAWAQKR